MKLLVVDDEKLIREVIREYGEAEGYEIVEAENGVEALKILDQENIDLMNIYIIKKDGKKYEVMIKQIIDCLKLLNNEEKEQTRNTLETVLEEKGKILDCLIYLGVGCMKILDEVHSEEDEEAM